MRGIVPDFFFFFPLNRLFPLYSNPITFFPFFSSFFFIEERSLMKPLFSWLEDIRMNDGFLLLDLFFPADK